MPEFLDTDHNTDTTLVVSITLDTGFFFFLLYICSAESLFLLHKHLRKRASELPQIATGVNVFF